MRTITENMDTQEQKNETIEQELIKFSSDIDAYRASLNTEGVWLFLTTLSCWSVTEVAYQFYAIAITFILFTHRIYTKLSDKRSFSSIIKSFEERIRNDLAEGDTQKARLHDLYQIRDVNLAIRNHAKSVLIFLLCYSFLAATLWHSFESISS